MISLRTHASFLHLIIGIKREIPCHNNGWNFCLIPCQKFVFYGIRSYCAEMACPFEKNLILFMLFLGGYDIISLTILPTGAFFYQAEKTKGFCNDES